MSCSQRANGGHNITLFLSIAYEPFGRRILSAEPLQGTYLTQEFKATVGISMPTVFLVLLTMLHRAFASISVHWAVTTFYSGFFGIAFRVNAGRMSFPP
jgi:hypothetical protein